jgi:Na+-translocating ferredoxin:NAD+ oxidoreductase RnfC subunit
MLVALPEDRTRRFLAWSRPGFDKDGFANAFATFLLPTGKRADTNLKGEARPCLSCGFCGTVCPSELFPHLLSQHVERGLVDEKLQALRIFDCMECNLCSYVCPSKVGPASRIR